MAITPRTVKKNGKVVDKYYRIEIYDNNKKVYSEDYGKGTDVNKRDAQQRERKLKLVYTTSRPLKHRVKYLSDLLFIFIHNYKKRNKSWKKAESSLNKFLEFTNDPQIKDLNSSHIKTFKTHLQQEGYAVNTINSYLSFIRSMFNYAMDLELYDKINPVKQVKLFPRPETEIRILSYDEEERLLSLAKDPLFSLIKTALLTGFRMNEIRTLEWENIDLELETITIELSLQRKKRQHTIPLSSSLKHFLLEQKLKSGSDEYVFPEALKVSLSSLSQQFKRLCNKVGIENFRFNDLRHTVGARLAESGYDIVTIKDILGHSSVVTTQIYTKEKHKSVEAIESLSKPPEKVAKEQNNGG